MGSSWQQVLAQSPDGEAEVFTTDVTELVAVVVDVDVLAIVAVFTVGVVVVVVTTVVRSSSAEVRKTQHKRDSSHLNQNFIPPELLFRLSVGAAVSE